MGIKIKPSSELLPVMIDGIHNPSLIHLASVDHQGDYQSISRSVYLSVATNQVGG